MRIENNNITSPVRGYELRGRKGAKTDGAAPSFEAQITRQSAGEPASASASNAAELPAASVSISGEEYLKLQQESAAANSPEAKSAAEHKALIETANQAPLEESTSGEKAAASKTSTVPPMPDFSGMSDSQKLSALRKLHEETDYSGMTDTEKYKLMNDRFEAAFPNLGALLSGIYGPTATNFAKYNPNYNAALPERISEERHYQWTDLGLKNSGKVNPMHKEAYYSGMTDEEIISAISQKYSGGTIADRAATLRELRTVGLDNGVAGKALDALRSSIMGQVRGVPAYGAMFSYPQNAMEFSRLSSLVGGTRMSWGAIGSMVLDTSRDYAMSTDNPALALKEHEEFAEKWNELLELLMQAGV